MSSWFFKMTKRALHLLAVHVYTSVVLLTPFLRLNVYPSIMAILFPFVLKHHSTVKKTHELINNYRKNLEMASASRRLKKL